MTDPMENPIGYALAHVGRLADQGSAFEKYGLDRGAGAALDELIEAAEQAEEALWNVPCVGEEYDEQHAGTHLNAVARLREALDPFRETKFRKWGEE